MEERKPMKKTALRLAFLALPLVSGINTLVPGLFRRIINKKLSSVQGFSGQLQHLNISFLKGEFEVTNLQMQKSAASGGERAFLFLRKATLRINRMALWRGALVGEIHLDMPSYVHMPLQEPEEKHFPTSLFSAPPFPVFVEKMEIINGSLDYLDRRKIPAVELTTNNINAQIHNIANFHYPDKQLPVHAQIKGEAYGGEWTFNAKINLLESTPAFDMDMELKEVNMTGLNPIFKAYGKFDVNSGVLNVFSEVAAKQGKFKGYVKPLISDLDVLGPEDRDKKLIARLWEGLIGASAFVFTNPIKDQLGTKLPLEGELKDPKVHVAYAIGEVLINAFVAALRPSIDYEININSVKK
ncbi:MAG: DUF748 domain-containing protein [Chitinophagales bacterium]